MRPSDRVCLTRYLVSYLEVHRLHLQPSRGPLPTHLRRHPIIISYEGPRLFRALVCDPVLFHLSVVSSTCLAMNSTPPPSKSTEAASFSSDSECSARDDCAAGSQPAPFRSAPRRSHRGSTRPWHSHSAETTPESQKVGLRPGGAAAGVWRPVRTADVCAWRPRRDPSDSTARARRLPFCMLLSLTVLRPGVNLLTKNLTPDHVLDTLRS